MDRRTATIVAAASLVAVLLVLGFAFGWFGGGGEVPPPATTIPAPAPGAGGTPQQPALWDYQHLRDADGNRAPTGPGPLIEIEWASTGFCLVNRRVFARMIQAGAADRIEHADWPVEEASRPHLHEFFLTGVVGGYFWSEDFSFCHRWRLLGGRVSADTAVKLVHWGEKAYAGDPRELLTAPTTAAEAA